MDEGETFGEARKIADPREASLESVNFPALSVDGKNTFMCFGSAFLPAEIARRGWVSPLLAMVGGHSRPL